MDKEIDKQGMPSLQKYRVRPAFAAALILRLGRSATELDQCQFIGRNLFLSRPSA
jgi:hypothetical protein